MKPQIHESRWTGKVLRDKWHIDGRIARGGMGTVFQATHRNNGSLAAIKILHPQFSRDSDTRSRFLQEGYAANQVNHPGVVRIIDDDVTEEGLAYLVMELLEGELLEQRRIRKGGKLPLAEVYELADQLLDVLAAAHDKDIVHRDIKPDNIFLTTQGRIKVLDFGFAQMKSGFRTETTATGFLLGTPGFMAPEQAIGNRPLIDARTDIWAAGATLFMLLTGQPVHPGESPAEMLVAAANYPVRAISTLEPGLPTKLAAAIDKALAFDKKDRWVDARSLQAALRAVPGRAPPKEPIRRSIVDIGERYNRPVSPEDSTELDSLDALEAIEDDALHPAEGERPTLAVASDDETIARPSPAGPFPATDPSTRRAGSSFGIGDVGFDAQSTGESTIVMHNRPRHPDRPSLPAPRPAAGLPPFPMRPSGHDFAPLTPPSFPASGRPSMPSASFGDAPSYRAPQLAPTVPIGRAKPPSRVLVYIVVAGITMIVVILTGLLVILASD